MKVQPSRWMWIIIAVSLVAVVGGKFALEWYFSVPEPRALSKPASDELHDQRTTEQLESLRFGTLSDDEVQRQCEALVQENGWEFGATLSEIRAAGKGSQELAVQEMFLAFRSDEVKSYDQKTKDSGASKTKGQELLKIWANADVTAPDVKVLDQIGKLAHEALAAGSADPIIKTMALCYQSAALNESDVTELAKLPDQITAAGYSSAFCLLASVNSFQQVNENAPANRSIALVQLIKDFVRFLEEYSSDSKLDRVTWFMLYNNSRLFNDDERELLYRRMLISDKIGPYIMHLMAGFHHEAVAENTRGRGFASSVSEDAWPAITQHFDQASLHFRKAWLLRSDLPHPAWSMIANSNVNPGDEHWSPRQWFELTCRAQFDFVPAYTTMLNALLPRWGGSHEAMLEFGKECAATKEFDTTVPFVMTDCVGQIAKETRGGGTWEDPEYISILTDFWATMDAWATQNKVERTAPQWNKQLSFRAAVLIRNRRYTEAKSVVEKLGDYQYFVPMLNIVPDPDLAVASAFALGDAGSESLIEIEKTYGTGLPKDVTAEKIDAALKVVAEARQKCQDPRAMLYFLVRENSLAQQKKFVSGEWVDLEFDPELKFWMVQDSVATVESARSLRLSNVTLGDSTQLAIPRVPLPPPYELHATIERIRGTKTMSRIGVNVGALSQAVVFGEPGGITFVMDDEPRVAGTFMPNGVQAQVYYVKELGDTARFALQIWPNRYRFFVNTMWVPVQPVSEFRSSPQLSLGGNAWEVGTGDIRISDVRIRKMQPSPPPRDDSDLEKQVAYLTKVVESEPQHVQSRLFLADLLVQEKKTEEAVKQYEAAYQLDPSIQRIQSILGFAYVEAGRDTEALKLLLAASKVNPADDVLDSIAWIYAVSQVDSLRNGSEALKISTEICDRTQNNQWNYLATKAAALAEVNRFPEAIELLQTAIKVTPPENQELMQAMLTEFQQSRPWRTKPKQN